MTTTCFTYTKTPTDITDRVVIVLSTPSNKYFGIDVSDLDMEDQALVDEEIRRATESYNDRIKEIMTKFDIRTNYRSFLLEKMSNIIVE